MFIAECDDILTCLALLMLLLCVSTPECPHLCRNGYLGQFKTALEGALTIFLLYLLLLTLLNHTSFAQGIPFAGKSKSMWKPDWCIHAEVFLVFVLECADWISLTFLIAILSGIFAIFCGQALASSLSKIRPSSWLVC
ncbi:MAG: hypothetical protein ACLVHV_04965 [Oscillospiraceae bacterium]